MLHPLRIGTFILTILVCMSTHPVLTHGRERFAPQEERAPQAQTIKPWTFLVYMARDNNLAPFGTYNINQMMAVSNPNVNILVYDCHNLNNQKKTQKIVISNKNITILETLPQIDSGDEETFLDACLWAEHDFPSERLAIVAWNHGSGMLNRLPICHNYLMRGFCYDDTTGNYLDDIKIMRCLDKLVHVRNGKKVDIFGFDACLMADVEMIDALAPYVDYTIASQETIPGYGWNYTDLLTWPNQQVLSPIQFSQHMVKTYQHFYTSRHDTFTLSAIRNENFTQLHRAIDTLAQQLTALLKSKYAQAIHLAIQRSVNAYFAEATYMDLYQFCIALANYATTLKLDKITLHQLKLNIMNCMTQLQNSLIATVKSNNRSRASGMSIYFPRKALEPSYLHTHFAQNNSWLTFIKTYLMHH